MLALTAALALVFLGFGWYLGWYKFNSTTTDDGHRQISIDLDTVRIKTDVGNKVRDLFDKDKSTPTTTTPVTTTSVPKTTAATPTGFRPGDGAFVFPGEPFTPVPPGGGPSLPTPR